jgi:uncharacterized protein (DUF433 family)
MSEGTPLPPALEIAPEAPPLRVDPCGIICVGATRVTLDSLVAAFHRGETPEEIGQNYDALSLREVYQAIGFYLAHQSEVERYLAQRQQVRARVRQELEDRHRPIGVRARLLGRTKPSVHGRLVSNESF